MADEVKVVTSQSWFSRITDSIKSILLGILLFIAAFPLLFWNEGRAVKTAKSLQEGSAAVVTVSSDKIDPATEGKLVHVIGSTSTEDILTDGEFDVSATAIKLKRGVEMYQWVENQKSESRSKVGGGTETVTTYSYEKKWTGSLVNSSKFNTTAGHENPAMMPYEEKIYKAENVNLGAFKLSNSLIDMINNYADLSVLQEKYDKLSPELKLRAKLVSGLFYISQIAPANPSSPQVGDVKISYKIVKPSTISIVSKQLNNSFEPYMAKAGGTIELLEIGSCSAENMFKAALARNTMLTWILRLVGFLMMAIGLNVIFKPLVVLADVLPFLGALLGAGIGLVSGIIAFSLSMLTIAISWLFYRPIVGVLLIIISIGSIFGLKAVLKSKKAVKPK